jgi:hypothetical protein
MWTAGMSEWRMAGQVDRFAPLFGASGPPAMPPGGGAPSASSAAALNTSLPVWGLFGRSLLVMIGHLLIILSPWTSTAFYKWLCERVSLPDGRRLKFAGKPGDIWYVFIAWSILIWVGALQHAEYVTVPLSWILAVLLLRWICANVSVEDGSLRLAFEGGFLPYIGWNLLFIVSFITRLGVGHEVHDAMDLPECAGDDRIRVHGNGALHFVEDTRLSAVVRFDHPDSLDDAVVHALDDFPGVGGEGQPGRAVSVRFSAGAM